MTYVFDIDGTICTKVTNGDYRDAKPFKKRIEKINNLFERGNTIIFQTARGMGRNSGNVEKSYEQFYDLTLKQLSEWGVKYHRLFLGKPAGDIYVDDKAVQDFSFFEKVDS